MAKELADTVHDAFNSEVRVLPIARSGRTAGDIERLRQELEIMKMDRVPLIWSASDIQTLINSFFEDLEGSSESRDTDIADKLAQWQKLFTFLSK
jgi:hypothetical protein